MNEKTFRALESMLLWSWHISMDAASDRNRTRANRAALFESGLKAWHDLTELRAEWRSQQHHN
jgi:hypothetical protein